jgi:P4 family phage/plasmid primase-like protien
MAEPFKKNKNYTQDFYNFLADHKVQRGDQYSHISLGHPKGCYLIEAKDKEKYFDLYKKTLIQGTELFMAEVHRSQGPIIVDLDIKFPKDKEMTGRIYEGFLLTFIKLFNEIIIKYLLPDESEFLTFVFEKNKPTERQDCYKDGIHLMYPYICTTNKLQYVMRNELVQKVNEVGLFDNMGLINKTEDIIDKAVIETNSWLMYKSNKEQSPPYILTQVYNYDRKPIEIIKYDNENIYELLSIRKFGKEQLTEYRDGFDEATILKEYEKLNKKKIQVGRKHVTVVNNQEDIRTARELCELLNPNRANSYETWLNVGFCLHNIDYCLLETWIEFSKLSPNNFKDGECDRLWETFRNNNYSLGSLYRWAKEDNPEKYADFLMTKVNEAITESIDGTSYAIAKAFYKIYRFNYVCADIKNNLWYEFKNPRWIECEEGHTIYTKLNEDMANQYLKLVQAIFNKALLPNITAKEKEELLDNKKKVEKIYDKIRNVALKNNIITECRTLFYDPLFKSMLNENKNVLVFNNGVYDFKERRFRDGLPEDFMSYTSGTNYIKYDPNHNYIKEIDSYFKSIQPEDDMHKYILDNLSLCLTGLIPDEKFHIWTGSGCHAKGTKILMYDGNYRNVEDIQYGELIMGDDSKKRTVNQVFKGKSMMYKVNQLDFGSSYVVNGDHVLVLRIINSKILNELEKYIFKFRDSHFFQEDGYYYIEIKLEDYLKIDDKYKKYLYGYKKKILDNHTYNNDYMYYINYAQNESTYNQKNIKKLLHKYEINDINKDNKDYILVDENLYKNLKSFRLNKRIILLETIILDNAEIKIDKVNDIVLDEILKLCHSVGYHTIIYEDAIKVFKNSIPLSKISIEKLHEDEFFGFEINGNHRYMMADGTITHNSNGKSITVDMLNNALGDFAAEVQITLLTRKRPDATAPNPELARTKGKRFVTLQEPENTDTLQIGYLKSLTGGAKVSTRTLNEKTFEFEPQFKLFLLCNKVPEIPSNDGGTWRRVRVTPYEMKFVDNPTKPHERKADRDLKEKIKTDTWREALLAFLINHYDNFVSNKPIIEPQKVLKYTKMYQDISDVYQNFLNDRVQLTNNNRDKVSYKQLYEEFKTWFQLTRNVRTTVKASEFKIEIINKMPPDAVKVQSQFIKGMIIKAEVIGVPNTNNKNNDKSDTNDEEHEEDDESDNDNTNTAYA